MQRSACRGRCGRPTGTKRCWPSVSNPWLPTYARRVADLTDRLVDAGSWRCRLGHRKRHRWPVGQPVNSDRDGLTDVHRRLEARPRPPHHEVRATARYLARSKPTGVAELVMQPHADRAETTAGQPGAIEQLRTRVEAVEVAAQGVEALDERPDGLRRPLVGLVVGVIGVQRLDGVSHGVDRTRDGHRPRQGGGELDVVDDRVGQDLGLRSRGLLTAGRLPQHRRDLRTGVRGRHHQMLDAQA